MTRLHDVAIEANKERQPDGKWLIETSSSDALRAIKYLDDSRVFRQEIGAEENNSSMLPNRDEQRARAARRLAKEIEFSLRSINGVLESHVHLNLPPLDPLFGQKISGTASSASVVAVVDKSSGVQAADIAQLVSGATGVEIKSVAVLLTPGAVERQATQLVVPPTILPPATSKLFGFDSKQLLLIFAIALLVVATLIATTLLRSKRSLVMGKL
jgi:type III secretory pathway lipoprotein EscJ